VGAPPTEGFLADKLSHLLLDALARAALAPTGSPLIGAKAAPGLFPATAPARQAAQRAVADGLIRLATGKPDQGLYTATDAGLAYLVRHTSPKQVLEDLARAIEGRHSQIDNLLSVAHETKTELAAIKCVLEKLGEPGASATGVLLENRTPVADAPGSLQWLIDLRQHLSNWDTAGDCPLPDLYQRLQAAHPALTIGRFHDGLRELHDREQVYLHPWTGPLYALPEPAFALMIGHEIAYYASLRSEKQLAINDKPEGVSVRRCAPALA
jgi:hypothetical protein